MINSETMDIYIDPYTHTNSYRVNFLFPCAISFASRYIQKLEVRLIGIHVKQTLNHYTKLSTLLVLFYFIVFAF